MAKIEQFLPIVLKLEGGFVNDPKDRGGATNKGITLNTYRSFFSNYKTVEDLKNISDEQVRTIYKHGYWDKIKGDSINNQSVANLLCDFAVNSGAVRAIRYAQALLGVSVDGVFGNKTLNALNAANQPLFFKQLKEQRKAFYHQIVNNNASQSKFLNGWLRRLEHYTYAE